MKINKLVILPVLFVILILGIWSCSFDFEKDIIPPEPNTNLYLLKSELRTHKITKITEYQEYTYDTLNRIILIARGSADNILDSAMAFIYSEDNPQMLITINEMIAIDSDNSIDISWDIIYTTTFTYTNATTVNAKRTSLINPDEITNWTYTMDANNNVVRIDYPNGYVTFTYTSNNLNTLISNFQMPGSIVYSDLTLGYENTKHPLGMIGAKQLFFMVATLVGDRYETYINNVNQIYNNTTDKPELTYNYQYFNSIDLPFEASNPTVSIRYSYY